MFSLVLANTTCIEDFIKERFRGLPNSIQEDELTKKIHEFRWCVYLLKPHQKTYRSSPLEVFLRKAVIKIYSKFIGDHPCQSEISIKLQLY